MEKLVDCISHDGKIYVIDRNAKKASLGDWVYESNNPIVKSIVQVVGDIDLPNKPYNDFLVIASNDESLNLPLLPVFEKDTLKTLELVLSADKRLTMQDLKMIKFGYEIATVTKQYSDENIVDFLRFLTRDHNHKYMTQKDAWDDFKLSLLPIPKQLKIEMEMEYITSEDENSDPIGHYYIPKVKNGFLVIKEIIW